MDRLEEIAERAEKATPGPWKQDEFLGTLIWGDANGLRVADVRGWGHLTGRLGLSEEDAYQRQDATGAFIAHSREDIPWLIEQVHTLREALERVAKQKLSDEMATSDDDEYYDTDFEDAYDMMVRDARAALKQTEGD